ncbi:hypothetical protein RBTH_09164 [Bacillus thuringiensis serovar israelensis ATCC 35646]|nr:hypothetical protein RBTH_09164 [Bacillus thuringiensis serovar israelensis ATCC 35646]
MLASKLPKPSTSLRQSRRHSQATLNQFISSTPLCAIRVSAASATCLLKVPEASVTANTSYPASIRRKVQGKQHKRP